jgi:hypothetical protein
LRSNDIIGINLGPSRNCHSNSRFGVSKRLCESRSTSLKCVQLTGTRPGPDFPFEIVLCYIGHNCPRSWLVESEVQILPFIMTLTNICIPRLRAHLWSLDYTSIFVPTGKLISTWAQVDPNELIWSQTFLWDQVGDNLIPNIHDI